MSAFFVCIFAMKRIFAHVVCVDKSKEWPKLNCKFLFFHSLSLLTFIASCASLCSVVWSFVSFLHVSSFILRENASGGELHLPLFHDAPSISFSSPSIYFADYDCLWICDLLPLFMTLCVCWEREKMIILFRTCSVVYLHVYLIECCAILQTCCSTKRREKERP